MSGARSAQLGEQCRQRDRANPRRQRICALASVNDIEAFEAQVIDGDAHRWCQLRAACALDFKASPLPVAYDEQVELGAVVRRPKECFVGVDIQRPKDALDAKAFPRRADLGMSIEGVVTLYAKECVHKNTNRFLVVLSL